METKALTITSTAFKAEGAIPVKYTCDGESVSPPLHVDGIPQGAISLAIIAEDPDAPKGTFHHWLVWNADPVAGIAEGGRPGISGRNGKGETGYTGPCPPTGSHRYYLYVFALDTDIDLPEGVTKDDLDADIEGHLLAKGSLMERYSREGK